MSIFIFQKVKAIILKDLIEYGKAASLMPYEQVIILKMFCYSARLV
jgi:hypothetical protein